MDNEKGKFQLRLPDLQYKLYWKYFFLRKQYYMKEEDTYKVLELVWLDH
jgi:hypothetical protein